MQGRSIESGEIMNIKTPVISQLKTLVMIFPLRDNYIAQILIPADLTETEADRIAKFIKTIPMKGTS